MKITDAQVHIWASGTPSGLHRQTSSFSADELLAEMDEAGVDGALIHPPMTWDPHADVVALEAVRRYPDRFAIFGQFPPNRPESRGLMESWKRQPGMLGLRWSLLRQEQLNWHEDGTMDWIWLEAERLGIPIALLASRFLPSLLRIAERHPNLRLIVDHLGLVRGAKDDAAFATLPDLIALSRLPNVAIKATGAPAYSSESYPYRSIHDGLHRMYDAFGPHRWFWGTDISRMPCSYRQCVTMFTEELPWLSGDDLERVMGRGLREWIGWAESGKS